MLFHAIIETDESILRSPKIFNMIIILIFTSHIIQILLMAFS